jgi:hypothetical protein
LKDSAPTWPRYEALTPRHTATGDSDSATDIEEVGIVRIDSYAGSRGDSEIVTSPFSGLSLVEATVPETALDESGDSEKSPFEGFLTTESPFGEGGYDEADVAADESADFLEAIHDEEFEDALDELLNEGAARVLADAQQWSSPPSPIEAREAIEQWIAPLVTEWERAVDGMGAGLQNTDLHGIAEQELDELLDSLESPSAFESEAFENFLGGLMRKAKGFIKNKLRQAVNFVKNPVKGVIDAAKSGLQTIKSGVQFVGTQLLGPLLNKLKSAGLALLKGVVSKLMTPLTRILPAAVQPLIPVLMKRLGIGEATDTEADEGFAEPGTAAVMAHEFDNSLLSLYLTQNDEDVANEADESYDEVEPEHDLQAELDDARARLATQLTNYTGLEPPIAEIEQFLPVILAIRPLLKLGLKLTGARDKLIALIASPLAKLIKGMIGPAATASITRAVGQDPSRMLARAAVDLGFSALGLEAPAEPAGGIAGEALVSAVEATAMRVADELDEAALTDPLQVSAAVQRAFAEAAAAYMPDQLLRPDLPERETDQEGGFWVMMPRSARPRYRFRKHTRVFAVTIPRQVARAMRWSDGGTLETYLVDRGVQRWPAQAEVDLYESLPGTVPGHFTRDETLPAAEHPTADEFQPLTAEAAGLLLHEPALGRGRHVHHGGAYRPVVGSRYYRIRVAQLPDRRARRPRRLIGVHWDPIAKRLRIAIRLSERRARELQARLERSAPAGQRDLPGVLTELKRLYLPRLKYRVARRLVGSSLVTDPVAAAQLAGAIAAATGNGLSTFLAQRGAELAAALADPAGGVTIRVTFDGITANPSHVAAPTVSAVPGMVR